ncbi:MAG: nitroreductase family protein [Bacteroidota bacterium]
MNLQEVLEFRRSVRVFDTTQKLDHAKVEQMLRMSTLAPNSSNMQLWEFYHVTSAPILERLIEPCLNQSAVRTASDLVVFVTRRDLHRKRAKAVLSYEEGNIRRNSPPEAQERRIKDRYLYYGKVMPLLYSSFFRLIGLFRKAMVNVIGLFRPIVYEVSESDMRGVLHKTSALAAQTFMIAMANEGYDTCPLEGIDSRRVKKILGLPYHAEITMIVACGVRKGNEGIWGDRYRVPFEEVYHKV